MTPNEPDLTAGVGDPVRLRPGIEWRNISGSVVALDLESSTYLSVNGSGSCLWPLVVAGTTEAELVEELVSRFEVDAEQGRRDVAAFLARLRDLSLIGD